MNKVKLLLTTLSLLFSLSIQAEIIEGKVVKIADGDTLTLLTSTNQQVKVRLAGIDTHEKKQPFGKRAKQTLANLAFQKQDLVEVETKDRYGRTVGTVFVGSQNLNAELVRQGMAWVYRKYTNYQKLFALEADAKEAKRGLWSSNNPIKPWLWRKGKRTAAHDTSMVKGMIIGNKNSHIFHLSNCPSYYKVAEKNRIFFADERLALANGYRKAKNCP